jgi:protein-S-isoprenylcysteine O-methyltransferase Ste14
VKKLSFLAFSAFAYVVFLATFLYLIAFVAGLPMLPHGIDHGEAHAALPVAAALDLLLVTIFAAQHSTMARPAFKSWWSRIVPTPIERSAYVLAASSALIVLFAFWQPIATTVWSADGIAAAALWALFGLGWLVVLISTFLISHFELFGLKQAWIHWCGLAQASPVFRTPWLYKLIRHPLYLGFFLAFWSIPTMTVGHLLFALGMSTFMLVAIRFEERDLVDTFGESYVRYRARTGMLLPRLRPTPSSCKVAGEIAN